MVLYAIGGIANHARAMLTVAGEAAVRDAAPI